MLLWHVQNFVAVSGFQQEHFDSIGGNTILFISAIILANFTLFFYYFMFRAWNDSIGGANLSIGGPYAETS